MDTAAIGLAQKEDREGGIHEQDVFDGVVFFLAAITFRLCSRVLGADDAPFRPVMGKRGAAGAAAGTAATGAGSSAPGGAPTGPGGSGHPRPPGRAGPGAVGGAPGARGGARDTRPR